LYRQDNPNSSINNKAKVYCVCDEYEFIIDFLNRNPDLKKVFIFICSYRRYYSYKFVLKRIGQQFRYDFIQRFSTDFESLKEKNFLDSSLFTKGEWNELMQIIQDPEGYYFTNYYLKNIDNNTNVYIKLEETQRQLLKTRKELDNIYKSISFKVGRLITWFPRKIRQAIKCFKEHGFKYTLKVYLKKIKKTKVTPFSEIKILFIASDNNRASGAFLSMVTLCRILKENYNVYTYVILPQKGNGNGLLNEAGIDNRIIKSFDWIIPINKKRDFKTKTKIILKSIYNRFAANRIARFARYEKFNLIHINTTYSYVGAIAARQIRIPYVWHLREFLEEDQGKMIWNKNMGYKLINKADKIIAISQSIYNKYLSIFNQEKLDMIYNGIDANVFYNLDKRIFENKNSIFIFVGNFAEHKGHAEFASACAKLKEFGIYDFEIWFIGSGSDKTKNEIELFLIENGLGANTKYLGYQKDVDKYYLQADIAFTCSKSEAFGRVTVEAMLSGNLVIGAGVAGTKELIDHGITGLLYTPGNADDLAEKILYALNHKEEMKVIADSGRKYMYENMTVFNNAKNVANVYKDILI
jgi:glycosyltransferase involved in cell wall biosynthesis